MKVFPAIFCIFRKFHKISISVFEIFPIFFQSFSNAGCTLSPREPETMRERECRWKHLPRMFWCSLGRSCLTLLALAFLGIHDVRVKGSHVSPVCRLVSCATIKSSRQECRESHSPSLVSCNSRSRILPTALGNSVQPAEDFFVVFSKFHWNYFRKTLTISS